MDICQSETTVTLPEFGPYSAVRVLEVIEGCELQGQANIKILWKTNGRLHLTGTISHLSLPHIHRSFRGVAKCLIKNKFTERPGPYER